ncbi:MAG: AcvB/VirJ family lysyl-phosphatidylglycerol hydrolase [Spirochaetota bacterium]
MRRSSQLVLVAAFVVALGGAGEGAPGSATAQAAAGTLGGGASSAPAARVQTIKSGVFGNVTLYQSREKPKALVLFASGDGGWNKGVVDMATILVERGAIVAGFDSAAYMKVLEKRSDCINLAMDFDELGKDIEARLKLPDYLPPILVGYSSGATLVYACLVQAPPGTFAGAISLGFSPDLAVAGEFCKGYGLASKPYATKTEHGVSFEAAKNLRNPWIVLQGTVDEVVNPKITTTFVEGTAGASLILLPEVGHGFSVRSRWAPGFSDAFEKIVARLPSPSSATSTEGLPLVELPVKPGIPAGTGTATAVASGAAKPEYFVILLSGDGGWASIDRSVAEYLNSLGLPVVGFDSLSYFWKARDPEGLALDLARVIDSYAVQWSRDKVILAGYSFGADVLPFAMTRLPPSVADRVVGLVMIAPSNYASFKFQVAGWFGAAGEKQWPTVQEVAKLKDRDVMAIIGSEEKDSLPAELAAAGAKVKILPGGHHFSNNYKGLAKLILEMWPR